MATVPWFGAETAALVALGTAVDFGEFLTVMGALTPTPAGTGFVTGSTVALGFFKMVNEHFLGFVPGDDFIPVDALDVA